MLSNIKPEIVIINMHVYYAKKENILIHSRHHPQLHFDIPFKLKGALLAC